MKITGVDVSEVLAVTASSEDGSSEYAEVRAALSSERSISGKETKGEKKENFCIFLKIRPVNFQEYENKTKQNNSNPEFTWLNLFLSLWVESNVVLS